MRLSGKTNAIRKSNNLEFKKHRILVTINNKTTMFKFRKMLENDRKKENIVNIVYL